MTDNYYSQVLTEFSVTNTSYAEKATLDFTTYAQGDYLIFIQGMATSASTSLSIYVRGQIDDTTTIMEQVNESVNATRTNEYLSFHTFYLASALAAGAHFVDIDAYVESGATGYMKNIRIVVINIGMLCPTSGMYGYVATEASLAISAAAGSPTTLQTLNITPDVTGDYLILGTCELYSNSASYSAYVRLNITAGTEYLPIDTAKGSTAYEYCGMEDQDTSDRHTKTWGGVVSLTSGASRAILIEGYRTSTNTAAALKRRILAIRLNAASPLVQYNEVTTETSGTSTSYNTGLNKGIISWTPTYVTNWTIMGGMNFENNTGTISSATRLFHATGNTGNDSGTINECIKRNKQSTTTTTDSWPAFGIVNEELTAAAQVFMMQYMNVAAGTTYYRGGWVVAWPNGGNELSTTKTAAARIKTSGLSTTKASAVRVKVKQSTTKTATAHIDLPTYTYSTTKAAAARIKTKLSTTKTSAARVKLLGQSTTKTSTARVKTKLSTTKTSAVRVKVRQSTTKTSAVRVKILAQSTTKAAAVKVTVPTWTRDTTKSATARIETELSITKSSAARIKLIGQYTSKTSTARIKVTKQSTSKSVAARIKTELYGSKSSAVRVKTKLSTTKLSSTRIKRLAQSTTKSVAARIKHLAHYTSLASAVRCKHIGHSTTKTATAKIIGRYSTTKIAAARIKTLKLYTTKSASAKVSTAKSVNKTADVRVYTHGVSSTKTTAVRVKHTDHYTTLLSTTRIKSSLSTTKSLTATVVDRNFLELTAGANILPGSGFTLQAGAFIRARSWIDTIVTITKIGIPYAVIIENLEPYGIIEKINIPSLTIIEVTRN